MLYEGLNSIESLMRIEQRTEANSGWEPSTDWKGPHMPCGVGRPLRPSVEANAGRRAETSLLRQQIQHLELDRRNPNQEAEEKAVGDNAPRNQGLLEDSSCGPAAGLGMFFS